MSGSDTRASQDPVLFEIAGRGVTEQEVLRAADVRGDLEPVWRSFVRGLAAEQRAAAQGTEPDEAALESRSDAFRYERGLLTAEETEAWLEARELSLDDLDAYVRRSYLLDRDPDGGPPAVGDFHDASGEERRAFRAHWVLSGEQRRHAQALGRRMALFEGLAPAARPVRGRLEAERQALLARRGVTAQAEPAWLERAGLSADALDRLLSMEAAYAERSAAITTAKARASVREAMRLPLTRVLVETVEVASMDAAREAILCLREDGAALEALAKENGLPYARLERFVEDLPEGVSKALISAAPGDVLDPIGDDDALQVVRLISKREPETSDPEVLARIDREIVEPHFADLVAQRVRWTLRDESAA